jgi:hypothetical protein
MRVRRDIGSIPVRSASETWSRIVELITARGSRDVDQLAAAGSVIASIISDETPAEHPFILEGCGPQLRIYCRYGSAAIQSGGDVDALTWNPTEGDWTLHVPCDAENLGWVKNALARTSPRIKPFDAVKTDRAEETEEPALSGAAEIVVDWSVKD